MWTALALHVARPGNGGAANGAPNPYQLGSFVFSEGMMSGLLLLGLIALILAVVAQLLNRDAKLLTRPRGTMDAGGLCPGDDRGRSLAVSRVVTYSNMVADPPINHLANSPVRQFLGAAAALPRVCSGSQLAVGPGRGDTGVPHVWTCRIRDPSS